MSTQRLALLVFLPLPPRLISETTLLRLGAYSSIDNIFFKMNELSLKQFTSFTFSLSFWREEKTRGQYPSFTGFKATYIIPLSIPMGQMSLLIFSKRLHSQPLCLFLLCLDAP